MYRVPSLLNVKETAPYFHNGAAPTLDEAVRLCGKGGSNLDLSERQVKSIAAFLGTLSGQLSAQTPPKLP